MDKKLVSKYNCVVGKSLGSRYTIFREVFCTTCMPLKYYVCGAPPHTAIPIGLIIFITRYLYNIVTIFISIDCTMYKHKWKQR